MILPQYEIGLDSGALRAFAQAVEDLGYQYLVAFDSLCTDNPCHMPPLPLQRPIPIWLGGWAEAVLQRVGVLSDGWMPVFVDPTDEAQYEELHGKVARLRDYTSAAGRPRDAVGIDAQSGVRLLWGGEEKWATTARAWRSLGATHLSVDTIGASLTSLDAHLDALRRIKEVLDT